MQTSRLSPEAKVCRTLFRYLHQEVSSAFSGWVAELVVENGWKAQPADVAKPNYLGQRACVLPASAAATPSVSGASQRCLCFPLG